MGLRVVWFRDKRWLGKGDWKNDWRCDPEYDREVDGGGKGGKEGALERDSPYAGERVASGGLPDDWVLRREKAIEDESTCGRHWGTTREGGSGLVEGTRCSGNPLAAEALL